MEGYFAQGSNSQKSKKTVFAVLGLLAVVGVVATVAVASSSSVSPALAQFVIEEQEFREFMDTHGKSYSSNEEYQMRFKIFRDNSAYIRIFNSFGNSWALGVNKFADMSFPEFKAKYLPYKFPAKENTNVVMLDEVSVPSAIDWTTKGAVTAVKNQGQCGSCWSFSTTGSVEGAWFLSGHTLVSLSEQELVDCSTSYGNQGCNGGLMDNAFKYIIAKGITSEANYPYTAKDGLCNKAKASQVNATISKYTDVAKDNISQLFAAVAQQPVSVAVEANQDSWQLYKSGIVTKDCGTALDHGVLIVGYNQTSTPQYWKVKNSWGADWGEQGFIRIAVKAGAGICGINMQPSYPTV
ncbi:unnamed protein product [Blepharisma stoltei]|uniref:Uncharacterized protein n=1 Tax=Blepharisma stoltei TaxID=1481888 RepID=A0AAU9IH59_9CILI|nr:unnamed protein product [Blepharisma stoltei]